ncbi:hypothetical protein PLESTM_000112600 [Pleodorina starrii]|nr:hypothetical protein PLESTM_000112600 [Pleodorina starrii]
MGHTAFKEGPGMELLSVGLAEPMQLHDIQSRAFNTVSFSQPLMTGSICAVVRSTAKLNFCYTTWVSENPFLRTPLRFDRDNVKRWRSEWGFVFPKKVFEMLGVVSGVESYELPQDGEMGRILVADVISRPFKADKPHATLAEAMLYMRYSAMAKHLLQWYPEEARSLSLGTVLPLPLQLLLDERSFTCFICWGKKKLMIQAEGVFFVDAMDERDKHARRRLDARCICKECIATITQQRRSNRNMVPLWMLMPRRKLWYVNLAT